MRAKRLWNRINTQILVWAGDDRRQLKYDGKPILLPRHNEVALVGPGHPFRFESVKDSSDHHCPGTLLITDLVHRTSEGGITKTFDVTAFCEFLERDKEKLFESGLEIVSDWKDVPAAMSAARPLWSKGQVAKAQQILSTEMDRLAKYAEKGQPAPKASNADRVAWAITHLKSQEAQDVAQFGTEEIAAVLSGQLLPPKKEEVGEEAVGKLSAKQIMAEAKDVNLRLTKSEMEGLIEGDDEQIGFVLEKIKGRREAQAATA